METIKQQLLPDLFKITACPDCNGAGEIELDTEHEEWKDCETCNSTFPRTQIETPQLCWGSPLLITTLMRSETNRKKKDMELIVEKKSVYGNQLIYPICNKAKLFASISGNKTLLPEVIESIKKLGYNLTTKGEQI